MEPGRVRYHILYKSRTLNYFRGFMKFIQVHANLLTSRLEIAVMLISRCINAHIFQDRGNWAVVGCACIFCH